MITIARQTAPRGARLWGMPAIDIRKVPEEIRTVVARDAETRGMSVNDVIVETLASAYGVEVELTGYPYVGLEGDTDHWNIRVPDRLRDLLRSHATEAGGTMTGVSLRALSIRFGLPAWPIRSRRHVRLTADEITEAKRKHAAREATIAQLAREHGVKRETMSRLIRS